MLVVHVEKYISEYWTTIWAPDIWKPDKWKFIFQMFVIQIPTVFQKSWVNAKINLNSIEVVKTVMKSIFFFVMKSIFWWISRTLTQSVEKFKIMFHIKKIYHILNEGYSLDRIKMTEWIWNWQRRTLTFEHDQKYNKYYQTTKNVCRCRRFLVNFIYISVIFTL